MLMPCSLPLATLLWREAASKLRTRWEGAEREWRRLTAPAPAHSSCSALPPSPAARRSSSPRPDHCPSSHPVSACHKIPRASSRHSEWHCLADQPVRRLEQSRVISCNLVQSRAISRNLVQSRAAPAPGPLAGRRCPPGRPRGERGRRAARLQEKVPRRFRDSSEKVPVEAVRSPPVHRHRPCSVSVSRCDTHGPSTDVGAHALAEHTRSIARDLGQAHACRVKAQCDEEKLLPTPLRATLCERTLAS